METVESLKGWIVTLDTEGIPEKLKNWIGAPAIIYSHDRSRKLVLVAFSDGTKCEVHQKHLITLKRKSDIVRKVTRNWHISPDDFQTITKVSTLMQKGALVDALTLALSNPTVKEYCTVNCGELLDRKIQKNLKQNRGRPM